MLKRSGWIIGIAGAIVGWSSGFLVLPALSVSPSWVPIASSYIRPRTSCPAHLEALIPRMLRDLPSYANRVSQRAALSDDPADSATYVLLAGRPEYEPLTQGPGEYLPTPDSDLPQIFFTTLERQYIHDRPVTLQVFHWLFLTPTSLGWRLVLMQSAIAPKREPASAPDQATNPTSPQLSTPPQDSSQGVIAQAIRLWLRDCEAGSVVP